MRPVEAAVPYTTNDELPPAVRDHLPTHAQDIFREAFNHAYQEYGRDEATAFRVAWSAVKRRYLKKGGQWIVRPG